jgi:hypothetical protein
LGRLWKKTKCSIHTKFLKNCPLKKLDSLLDNLKIIMSTNLSKIKKGLFTFAVNKEKIQKIEESFIKTGLL